MIFSTLCEELYVFLRLFSLYLSLTLFFPQLWSLCVFCHAFDDSGWISTCWIWPASRVCGSFVSELCCSQRWKDSELKKVDRLSLLAELSVLQRRLCDVWHGWSGADGKCERRAHKARNSNGNSTKVAHDGRLSSSLGFFSCLFFFINSFYVGLFFFWLLLGSGKDVEDFFFAI